MAKSPLVWISILGLFGFEAHAQASDSLDMRALGRFGYTQTINDVWGWVDTATNKEYALVGVQNGLSIVDVTNPTNPVQTNFFSGASSIWRDMKTWGNYAYTVHDIFNGTSNGIFIVDMTTIYDQYPSTYTRNPMIQVPSGNFEILQRAHNIYIDEQGYLYLFGSNIAQGGALIFDLNPDPTNPTYLGMYNNHYLHDGVARGDTMWGAAINAGFFVAVDVSTPASPVQYNFTQQTPYSFTHNIWFSDDNQRVFTTDERSGAYIGEYDVSDFNNVSELDRIRTKFSNDVIPHNVHFHNNFLVNSYYTAGVQILDVSEPGIMVETGYYDTSNDSGDGFGGCWGAYPYLPSGNILATDRQRGLFVLSSDYTRASFINVSVIDSLNQQSLINADVELLGGDISGRTNIFGNLKGGQAASGTYSLVASKNGYLPDTISVSLSPGNMLNVQVALLPANVSLDEMGPLRSLDIYPNPLQGDQASLQLSQWSDDFKGAQYRLIDLNGRVLQSGTLEAKQVDLAQNQLAEGVYQFQISTGKYQRSFRLMIL